MHSTKTRTARQHGHSLVAHVRQGLLTGILVGIWFGAISGAGYTIATGGQALAITGWAVGGALVGVLATVIAAVAEHRAHTRPGEST
jgi:hypothetical protein